jgi:hypothetical protein
MVNSESSRILKKYPIPAKISNYPSRLARKPLRPTSVKLFHYPLFPSIDALKISALSLRLKGHPLAVGLLPDQHDSERGVKVTLYHRETLTPQWGMLSTLWSIGA